MSIKAVNWLLIAILLSVASSLDAQPEAALIAETSCVLCHSDDEVVEPVSLEIVQGFAADAHAKAGLSCHDCHGGNPDPALSDDPYVAMDESSADHPYLGTPQRSEVAIFCARCHSDPEYMRRFNPDLRTDQLAEYRTSQHGRALEAGNERVATCIDCHGAHGISGAGDPRSPVHPLRVADTCAACHSDRGRMNDALLVDSRALPVNQHALWQTSVHAQALNDKGDLSAPTCNDCHGNHGAAPPGQGSLAFVCGQCHGREAELFRASSKQSLFRGHNEYLAEVNGEGCIACHEEGEPQAELTGVHSFSECSSCHGHHAVARPSVALLSPLPETPCAFCHESPPGSTEDWEPAASREGFEITRDGLLARAPTDLEADQRFDWLVDQTLQLEPHIQPRAPERGTVSLKPEFERLFAKFRIGKTTTSFLDPESGETRTRPLVRCNQCHGTEPVLGDPDGAEMSEALLTRLWELSTVTARAERVLLSARRGGVETGAVETEIDHAIDAQIELIALVHSFRVDEESPFAEKHREGLDHARKALVAGRAALDELSFRRLGLIVALAFIALFLVALGLKIRQVDTEPQGAER